jgi:xylan 1,4-beta-xylosidase
MQYTNPVIPGFYPDPSVCRVGEDYYLVTSSFEYFPGVPVFHSRDLVHWCQIGHCLTRPSQLPLQHARSSGGIYAPTIRYHDGTFYMITTNVTGGGNFVVHTDDPAGEWSEPVWIDYPGIDPSLLFDDDGRVYFTNNGVYDDGPRGIYQFEIDLSSGQPLSEPRLVWTGTGGSHPEAPHLYKIDGRYYLMIAEGGTEYGHMVTVARSDNPYGPFASCPHNPILSHRSLDHPIQATGHADLIQTHDGSWWMVFLGIRPHRHAHHLGRETFLTPVTWRDGWPVVDMPVELNMDVRGGLPPVPCPEPDPHDDFVLPEPNLQWNFLRNPVDANWSLDERPGYLRLSGTGVTLDDVDSPAFMGRRQQHVNCYAAAVLDFDPQHAGDEAGLTALMNERHHYEIAVTLIDGQRTVIVRQRTGSLKAVVAQQPIDPGPVTLRISADRDRYTFSYALMDGQSAALASGETRYLSKEVADGFTGVYFGMYATGSPAYFDWFDYVPTAW